jgi:hypothetical protein
VSSSLSVVVLTSDISRALHRVLVSTFPEIYLLFMGRGSRQAQQDHVSVANNHCQSCKMKRGGTPCGQRASTQKRLRDEVEENNPDAKTQREEDGKAAMRNFFNRQTPRQSLPNIESEMSSEPSETPLFTTRTTPVQDLLLLRRVAQSVSCQKKLLSTWKAFRSELITVYEQPSATQKKASSTWS